MLPRPSTLLKMGSPAAYASHPLDRSGRSNRKLPLKDCEKALSRRHVGLVKLPRQVFRHALSRVSGAGGLLLNESLQSACTYRLHQRCVVALRLICIGEGERADGLVKGVTLAQIATDGRG